MKSEYSMDIPILIEVMLNIVGKVCMWSEVIIYMRHIPYVGSMYPAGFPLCEISSDFISSRRRQRTEDRGQRTEDRGQRTEVPSRARRALPALRRSENEDGRSPSECSRICKGPILISSRQSR